MDGRKYVVIDKQNNGLHKIMDIDGIGNREFNTNGNGQDPNKCGFINGIWKYETCNNQYEGSNIDQYLNGEYYNSLSSNIKDAIINVEIQQKYYTHTASNPKYKWVDAGDMNYDGCNNTVCVLQPNGKWIPWEQHTPVRGEMGAYKHDIKGDTDNFGNKTNVIKRKVFLPSVDEISSIVNALDQWEMNKFLRNMNGDHIHMWFRDGRDASQALVTSGHYSRMSLTNNIVRDTYIGVRPAFVINLNNVDYIKEAQP